MEKKPTFRQKWMPGCGDAEELRDRRYSKKGKDDYPSFDFPVMDFLEDG